MKKILLLTIILALIAVSATAIITAASKQDAITAYDTQVASMLTGTIKPTNIQVLTDKTCEIQYPTKHIRCWTEVSYEFNGMNMTDTIMLMEENTLAQDQTQIDEYFKSMEIITDTYEPIQYQTSKLKDYTVKI